MFGMIAWTAHAVIYMHTCTYMCNNIPWLIEYNAWSDLMQEISMLRILNFIYAAIDDLYQKNVHFEIIFFMCSIRLSTVCTWWMTKPFFNISQSVYMYMYARDCCIYRLYNLLLMYRCPCLHQLLMLTTLCHNNIRHSCFLMSSLVQ